MFDGWNVKLEATVTMDISKTDISFFQVLQRCPSLSPSSELSPGGHTYLSSSVTPYHQSLILLTEVTAEVLVVCGLITSTSSVS